ncbi:MAG: TolC family protein [Crocinitomicaceae bacterium]
MMRVIICLLFLLSIQPCFSQSDSIKLKMTYEDYLQIVKEHHPLAKQAKNQIELGEAYLLKSKGGFDPVLMGGINQKYFKGDQYYSLINAGLKVPTWYGVSVQAGYDLNGGSQLNPQRVVPDEGLWYAGINLALGKGLIIDKRRAEYKKAKIYVESSVQEQRVMLNELYLQSSMAYWEWYKAYNKMMVYQEAVENAFVRLEGVKSSANLGDKPFIDTLEASLQFQNRLFNFLDAELDYQNSREYLEIFLWNDGFVPVELDSNTSPPLEILSKQIEPELVLKIDSIKANHPELLNTLYKIEQSKVDLKLSRENLKPDVNFKYNTLTFTGGGSIVDNYSINNYNWGADIKIPIFLRKERGELRISKLKIENLEADLAFKTEQIAYKIDMTINQWATTYKQITIWSRTTEDYRRLLDSEKTLFDIGESSLFMVNSREKGYINARLKLIETITDNRKAEIKTKYALGVIAG